jgi:hypothetical protein
MAIRIIIIILFLEKLLRVFAIFIDADEEICIASSNGSAPHELLSRTLGLLHGWLIDYQNFIYPYYKWISRRIRSIRF